MIQGKQRTEKEYRKLPIDSSSSLKEFSLDRKRYFRKYVSGETVEEEDDNKAATTGKIVETLLFEKEQFDNRFYMSSIKSAPTGLMLAFVEALYKRSKETSDDTGNITKDFSEIVEEAYKDSGFKIKLEAVLNKFNGSDAEIYYKEIREIRSRGLTVVTIDDVTNGERVVESLKTNPFTSHIFNLVNSDRYTVLIQHQVDGFEIDGLSLKSMMDLVIIDNLEKTIQVYDLKCVWAVEGFYSEYYLYRRSYIQAYVYKEACLELKKRLGLDYTVLEPKFIVCDSIAYYNPLIYDLSPDDIYDAYNGFEHNGRKYPGVKSIISDLIWSRENNIWNISKTNFLNNGIVNIKN